MIDLDLKDFENNSKEKLDKQLKKTLDKLSLKFKGDAHPTVFGLVMDTMSINQSME